MKNSVLEKCWIAYPLSERCSFLQISSKRSLEICNIRTIHLIYFSNLRLFFPLPQFCAHLFSGVQRNQIVFLANKENLKLPPAHTHTHTQIYTLFSTKNCMNGGGMLSALSWLPKNGYEYFRLPFYQHESY